MNTIVVGLQFGDEGKGKIVDKLAKDHDWVVRYQGGANAGHTLYTDVGTKIVLHQVPSGILQGKQCYIGNGCVVDLDLLKEEIKELGEYGYTVTPFNLAISPKAHVLTWDHKFKDMDENKHIGTTNKGIGPAYADKIGRKGQRLIEWIINDTEKDYNWVRGFMNDPLLTLLDSSVLFEGAQGTMLDVDHGTYPYVTSSSCTAGGACTGTGFPPNKIDKVVGIAKAYVTRVGNGTLPTEIPEPIQTELRNLGQEYGATTGRPRRCGWLDLAQLNYACKINGVDTIYLTKLDVLFKLKESYIYHGYSNGSTQVKEDFYFGSNAHMVFGTKPAFQHGFEHAAFKSFEEFAKTYCEHVQKFLKVKVIASVGPKRNDLMEF